MKLRRVLVILGALGSLATGALRAQDLVVRTWLVRGPIPAAEGTAGLLRDYAGGEARLLPDSGDVVAGGAFVPATADSLGRINLVTLLRTGTDHAVAYAHTYLWVPTERTLLLVMDSDDDLAAFVNGQRVFVHEVARGVGTGRDTATVRFAAGWNSVLLKPRNRTGGFDVLGRIAPIPGVGSLDGVRAQARRPAEVRPGVHNFPAAVVTISPLRLEGPLSWTGDQLDLGAGADVTAWGRDTLRGVSVRFVQGGSTWTGDSVAVLPPGEPTPVRLRPTFDELRAAALGTTPLRAVVAWAGMPVARSAAAPAPPAVPVAQAPAARPGRRPPAAAPAPAPAPAPTAPAPGVESEVAVDPGRLVQLAGSRLALGSWVADSQAGQRHFQTRVIVPAVLAGQTLDLLAPEFGPRATYLVGGAARAWRAGAVELCAPCRTGDTLRLAITLEPGRPWWTLPVARTREPGYTEYAAGYGYARALAGRAPSIAPPDASEWLGALGSPGYTYLQARYRDAFAPLATEIRRDTLFLVGNSHIDAAWLWPWSETQEVIRNTWRTSLKLAATFPGYVFAASAAAYYDYLDREVPALADSIRRAVQAGQWAPVGGMWVEPDLNSPSGESLVRQGLYGQRFFQQHLGARSTVSWIPDSFGFPWTLPQIFRQLGFNSFVTQKIRWNDSTVLRYNAFYWEGRDGTRIFSYNPYGYTHELEPAELVTERLEDRQRTGGGHDQVVLYGVGDHGGGPTIEMLQRAEDLRRVPTFPTMRYAFPDSALDAVRTSLGDSAIPVWHDELYLEYHRGTYTTQARQKWSLAHSEALLRTSEALASFDTAAYPGRPLELVWRRVLFNQFHDILPGSSIHQVYLDANAQYDTAWAALDSLTRRGFAGLRARLDTRPAARGTVPVVVFNPLTWPRTALLRVPRAEGDTVLLAARDVPALGAKVFWVPRRGAPLLASQLPAPRVGPTWIENAFVRVEVDTATGAITRIYDKRVRREVLAAGARGNVLQVLGDVPREYDAWNIGYTGEQWEVTRTSDVTRSADAAEARLGFTRHWGSSALAQTLILGRESPFLEVRNQADWHETHKLLKVGFTLGVRADSATYAIPYGTIGRSGTPRTQAERAKWEVPGQRWADVSDSTFGVTLVTDSKYGWDYHGNVLRLSLLRSPLSPDSLADRGPSAFRFLVIPHAGDWRAAGTLRRAAEITTPLLAAPEPPHAGPLGPAVSFAAVDVPGVELTWVKRAEDSDALVLRLVEWDGRAETATVTLHEPIRSARRANLLEDPGEAVPVTGRTFRLALRPYEIATVLVEPAR